MKKPTLWERYLTKEKALDKEIEKQIYLKL